METINDLKDLLAHQLQSLYAAERQIMIGMPEIIARATHNSLNNALKHHSELTNMQLDRLEKVWEMLGLTTKLDALPLNKGIHGIMDEISGLLSAQLSIEVTDAAVIASVQKIEHYEITGYGTALTYAQQLSLHNAELLLNETLHEEYDADDLLTALAKASLNKAALPALNNLPSNETAQREKGDDEPIRKAEKVSISERTITSPGGRAGRSHRGYDNGESRGH